MRKTRANYRDSAVGQAIDAGRPRHGACWNNRLAHELMMEKLRRQNLVTDFRYSIAPQKIYSPQPPVDSGNFDIHYSEMKLQFDLLHEGQLLNFFAALRNQIKGHYQLESCALQRVADGNTATATSTHLKAECSGGWITLKNRNTQP